MKSPFKRYLVTLCNKGTTHVLILSMSHDDLVNEIMQYVYMFNR